MNTDPYAINSRLQHQQRGDQTGPATAFTRTVPFDYVVTVPLTGIKDSPAQSLVNISTVGRFIVTGIGYSLLPDERQRPGNFGPLPSDSVAGLAVPTVPGVAPPPNQIIIEAAETPRRSRTGPTFPTDFRLFGSPGATVQITLNGEFVKGGPFELDANGRRQLPELSDITARSTLILTDTGNGVSSKGITLLPAESSDTNALSVEPQFGPLAPRAGAARFDVIGTPGAEVEVIARAFDQKLPRLNLTVNVPVADEGSVTESGRITVNLEEANPRKRTPHTLVAGDLLTARDTRTNLSAAFQTPANPLDISLRTLPLFALEHGFKVNPAVLGRIQNGLLPPADEVATPFVPCGQAPSELSFLYSIVDNGTGRALQSEFIHNIAGLGSADGDRPFRTFPRPILLEPRSVLLFQIREISGGPGELYFVLQGYKVVGSTDPRLPGGESIR